MNLVEYDTKVNVLYRQSQLVGASVPKSGTMLLVGVGMLGLAIFGKHHINKDA